MRTPNSTRSHADKLQAEHIEKIVSTFDTYRDIAHYAAVVEASVLGSQDWNLNIRRYADNAPPPELHDVPRAPSGRGAQD